MLVLFLLVFFTPASVRSEWLSNLEASNNPNEIQEKGVLFHERSKILLAEKFIKVEFLVPFPTYDFALKPDIVALMAKLASMWELPSVFCPLDFSSHFSTNSTPFNVTWMLKQIETEIYTAELDVALLRNETAMFLSSTAAEYRHPALRQLRFHTRKRLPPGSLVSYFYRLNQRYIYNLVTKTRFFQKSTDETLQLSLMALRQHLERHNIRALSIPRLGSGLDKLHRPTVFSRSFTYVLSTDGVPIGNP